MPLVGVLMGSKSDLPAMQGCLDTLSELGIDHEHHVMSAHRTPQKVQEYASSAQDRGIEVIIAAAGMAATSYMKTWQDFDLIQLVVLPLFLFSGTFYPIEAYPPLLQAFVRITPLWQGVDLIRSLTVGAISPLLLVHVAYLTIMGIVGLAIASRRIDKILLK